MTFEIPQNNQEQFDCCIRTFSPRFSRSFEMRWRIDSPGVGVTTVVALSGRINLDLIAAMGTVG